jgi:protein O-mannosyl-transferase
MGGRLRKAFHLGETTVVSVLILFSVLPYSNTLLNGFVYDDTTQILDNPYILSFRHMGKIFTTPVWSYVLQGSSTNYYRPLMTFGYLLCFQVFGAMPYGYHLANVLLQVGVVCVLYILTRRMFSSRLVAFIAASLFALHPMHSESVNWIAAVTDLEVTFFFLLTFWFFLRVSRPSGERSKWETLGMAVAFILTILSKEQALMLPPLATVFEHFYRDDRHETSWKQKLSRYSSLWLLTIAYLLLRVRMFGGFAPVTGHGEISRYEAFLSGFPLVAKYVWKLLWPAHFSAFYVFHPSTSLTNLQVLAGIGTVAACGVTFALLWRRHRISTFGFVWFFATLMPVLNARVLVSDNVFAERYLYLPSVGFCWLAAYGATRLFERSVFQKAIWQWAWLSAFCVILTLYAVRIVTRNRVWRDEISLDVATLAVAPEAVPLYNNLGAAYWNLGDVASAEREWLKALEYVPDSATILNNLGLVCERRKEYAKAVDYFQEAIAKDSTSPEPHLNLGNTYHEMGLKEEAELQFLAAMGLAPLNVHIRNRLGSLYLEEGRIEDAQKQFAASASIAPNVVAYDSLGALLMERGGVGPAAEMFQRSLGLNARDTRARMNLARIFEAGGRKQDAVGQYRAILKYDPSNHDAKSALQRVLSSGTQQPGP